MKMSKKTKVVLYVILTLIAVYFLFPFVYMFFSTFKSETEAVAYPQVSCRISGTGRITWMHGTLSRSVHF